MASRPGWRRRLQGAAVFFMGLWLAAQAAVPLVRKFEWPSFRWRPAAFSWAMYCCLPLVYEVSLFEMDEAGRRGPIPDLRRIVRGHATPGPARLSRDFASVEQTKGYYTRLLRHIARTRGGGPYGVEIRWIRTGEPGTEPIWEERAPGSG